MKNSSTSDETWLCWYDALTKSQTKIWVFEDEGTPIALVFSNLAEVTVTVTGAYHPLLYELK